MKRLRLQTIDEATRLEAATPQVNKFAPAYSYGWSEHLKQSSAQWDEMEAQLRERWSAVASNPGLSWEEARDAVRDGWEHVSSRTH